jgi:PAS domain-containing protein
VAHLELSVSEQFAPELGTEDEPELEPEFTPEPVSSLERWTAAVSGALDPCLVIDKQGQILAISPAARTLLGFDGQEWTVGRPLLGPMFRLIDFGDGAPLSDPDREKLPPILACSSGQLAHGLIRIAFDGDKTSTLDAIAAPLRDGRDVVGSLTFFSPIRR